MVAWLILSQVILAMLAILGLILLWRAVFDGFFAPAAVSTVVIIKTKDEADSLDILLCEADKRIFHRRGVPTVVLISPGLMDGEIGKDGVLDPRYRALIEAHGAVVYIGSEQEQPSSA